MRNLMYSWLLVFVFPLNALAQDKSPVQFSGVIMSSDSLEGIPYASIIIKNLQRGTVSNFQGFFSFVSLKGDTIVISAIGYKNKEFTIPDTLTASKYSVIQLMTRDTVFLSQTIIYPWPTPEQFRDAFIALELPDDDLDRARKNIERERFKELGIAMSMDANQNSDYYLRQEAARFYYAGQYPPAAIFNPVAWIEFFNAWKRGDFRRKK